MALSARNESTVILTRQAQKFLNSLPKNYYRLLSGHLLSLEQNPFPHGSIKLKGSENEYRLRIGVYRILYTVEHDILTVTVIKSDTVKTYTTKRPTLRAFEQKLSV